MPKFHYWCGRIFLVNSCLQLKENKITNDRIQNKLLLESKVFFRETSDEQGGFLIVLKVSLHPPSTAYLKSRFSQAKKIKWKVSFYVEKFGN